MSGNSARIPPDCLRKCSSITSCLTASLALSSRRMAASRDVSSFFCSAYSFPSSSLSESAVFYSSLSFCSRSCADRATKTRFAAAAAPGLGFVFASLGLAAGRWERDFGVVLCLVWGGVGGEATLKPLLFVLPCLICCKVSRRFRRSSAFFGAERAQ